MSFIQTDEELKKLKLNSTDIFSKDVVEYYTNRPKCLESLFLAEFVANYDIVWIYSINKVFNRNKDDEINDDDTSGDENIEGELANDFEESKGENEEQLEYFYCYRKT
jgi:hypothetical protein